MTSLSIDNVVRVDWAFMGLLLVLEPFVKTASSHN